MRALVLVMVVASCGNKASSEQSFPDGVRALCDLPNHVPPPDQPYEKRLAGLAEWGEHNITNPEAKQVGSVKSLGANKDALAAAVAKAKLEHCMLLDNGMELQTFGDGMKVVCDATKPDPAYFKSHLLNTEVVRMLGALGDAPPADRRRVLDEAVARAGLKACPMLDAHPAGADLNIAKVPETVGLVELDQSPTLVVTPTGIVIDGKAIVAVTNGDVDPAEKEGGVLGIKIPRIERFMAAYGQELTKQGRPLALTLILDPTTPYRLLIEVMFTVKSAGFARFGIAVHAGSATKAIPLVLPGAEAKAAKGLRLIVSVTKTEILVWSISGQEGTLQKPKHRLALDHVADLAPALAAIAAKHKDEHTITIMCDGAIPMQIVAEALAAGLPAFSTLQLSTGFE